mmetsp:Transcript_36549/g.82217  ORF Transcript_36549/g.82217 Transcript_36549/m.82217 type:complete len:107 (+) Transcript_36549:63-383(+)
MSVCSIETEQTMLHEETATIMREGARPACRRVSFSEVVFETSVSVGDDDREARGARPVRKTFTSRNRHNECSGCHNRIGGVVHNYNGEEFCRPCFERRAPRGGCMF